MANMNWINSPNEETEDEEDFIEETFKVNVTNIDDDSDKEDNAPNTNKRKREPKEPKTYSDAWRHFILNWQIGEDGKKERHGRCKYCSKNLKAYTTRNDTSSLRKHYPRCKSNPENLEKQNILQFNKKTSGDGSVETWKHDEARIKKALLNLFVVGEEPFKFVQNEAFIEYTNALNGRVILPSRHTISKDLSNYYVDEKKKLYVFFSNPNHTINLTTDTWTSSCQRAQYMVITAHFIDDNWEIHKRIISFKQIETHKGEDVGLMLLNCIHTRGIKNVMTITVDNASSNNTAIEFLKRKLPNMYKGGKNFQVRCTAHILNLIVRDGLNEHKYSVDCVQKAVRYIRNSSQRISRFTKCMKLCGLETNKFLCGDCPTRWNSTYDMLKIALELREAFVKYELEDREYARELDRVPEKVDFDICKGVVGFLEKFKTKTEIVSASSKPLAHIFFREILDVDKHLREWETRPEFCLNDPQMKSRFIHHAFKTIIKYNADTNTITESDIDIEASNMLREAEQKLEKFFMRYKELYGNESSQEERVGDVALRDDRNDFLGAFLNVGGNSVSTENELKRYLREGVVTYIKDFDILQWWKHNTMRFPIVSRMAKDILGIQISTVTSESTFSMSDRILDVYRTNLSSTIVEALVCTKDWVRKASKPIVDDIDDILRDDDIACAIEEVLHADYNNGKATMPTDV